MGGLLVNRYIAQLLDCAERWAVEVDIGHPSQVPEHVYALLNATAEWMLIRRGCEHCHGGQCARRAAYAHWQFHGDAESASILDACVFTRHDREGQLERALRDVLTQGPYSDAESELYRRAIDLLSTAPDAAVVPINPNQSGEPNT